MNYEQIKVVSLAYADREDTETISAIDSFIELAEAKINRILTTRQMSHRAYAVAKDTEFYSLPPDYRGMRSIKMLSTLPHEDPKTCRYTYMSPEQMDIRKDQPYGGQSYYCVLANQIRVFPPTSAGDGSLEIVYFQKVPNLNVDAPENWLSSEHPDTYIQAIVSEIELFVKNYETADVWKNRYEETLGQIKGSDEDQRWSGNSLVTRVGR